jgi:hypothetical protein
MLTQTQTQIQEYIMNPYEIRLELLKIAKEMLEQDYFAKRDVIHRNWELAVDRARSTMSSDSKEPEHPDFPSYPSEDAIIEKAKALNQFISSK